MKIFDFNIHLPFFKDEDVNKVIENDMNLDEQGLIKGLSVNKPKFKPLTGGNFLLFNTNLFSLSINNFKKKLSDLFDYASLTALVDFRRHDLAEYLELVKRQDVRAVMVNSYLQQISHQDFLNVLYVFKFAEQNNMIICIDGSYGTSKMYSYDNMKLACSAADLISKVPIVIVHSGGLRIKEAMLLALDKPNVYLDSSFSLPFYLGSSLEQDYAFAYKKIGTNRIFYGSDTPYQGSDMAINIHMDFFKKHKFSDLDIEKIMFINAQKVLF